MRARLDNPQEYRDGRGRHEGPRPKVGYEQTAYEHKQELEEKGIGRACSAHCTFGRSCGMNMTLALLLTAHASVYGDNVTRDEKGDYHCGLPFREVKRRRRMVVLSAITYNAADPSKRVERFTVSGVGPVCAEYCRRAHGIPVGTWNLLVAAARSGKLSADQEWDDAAPELEGLLEDSAPTAAAKEETILWWMMWLSLEDQMPNEPVIIHRVVVWDSVHELEYKPDMAWFGTTGALSRPRWVSLRKDALIQLSIEWFGEDGKGKPLTMLALHQRAQHSNFANCALCNANKKAWVKFRVEMSRGRASPLDARKMKEQLMGHIRHVKAQRMAAVQCAEKSVGQALGQSRVALAPNHCDFLCSGHEARTGVPRPFRYDVQL